MEQVPGGPFAICANCYCGARLLLSETQVKGMDYVAAPNIRRPFIPSVWDRPTEVTSRVERNDAWGDLTTVIENGNVRLQFRSAAHGFGLGGMYLKSTRREAISFVDEKARFWEVDVRLADGAHHSITIGTDDVRLRSAQ